MSKDYEELESLVQFQEAKIAALEKEVERLKVNTVVTGKTSDGYHTFYELYDHRSLLFLAVCLTDSIAVHNKHIYWCKDHYQDWDLVVFNTSDGQISYHIPSKYREITERLPERDIQHHVYDGHTSADVLKRLEEWIRG